MRTVWIAAMWSSMVLQASGKVRSVPPAIVLQGDYTTSKAMEAMYGKYDDATKSSVWRPNRGAVYDKSWPGKVRVRPLVDAAYTDGGALHHMLVTWARPDALVAGDGDLQFTCHACAVLVGVSVLSRGQGGWKVESKELQLAMAGAWGLPPQAKLQRLGAHTYGLTVQMGDMHQGEAEQAIWIYGPKAGRFREWFRGLLNDPTPGETVVGDWCRTKSTNPLDVMCVWDRVDYSMVEVAGEGMYRLQVTKRVGSGAKTRETRTEMRFRGARYVVGKK